MNILEHQAKELLRAHGIDAPQGCVADSAEAAREVAAGLGGERWMVKAQIRAGGRGRGALAPKAAHAEGGGIRCAASVDEVGQCAGAMLGRMLVTAQTGADGLPIEQVYVERAIDIERELALSLLVDERSRGLALLLFERGGEDIETLAAQEPARVHRVAVTLAHGVDAAQLDRAIGRLGLDAAAQDSLREIVANAIRLLREKDARSIEINPLALVKGARGGALLALDAKMSFDRNALFRQPEILRLESEGAPDAGQRLASLDGFNYIPLDGDVACLTVGAGLSMATLDAVRHYRGRPANFLDLPPDAKVNKVVGALEILLRDAKAKSLLVNVFGGGIMRCDTISDAILLVNHSTPIRMPMSVRLSGTNSELANRRLKESAPQIFLASNLAEAAAAAVDAARGDGVAAARAPSWLAKCARALRFRRGEAA